MWTTWNRRGRFRSWPRSPWRGAGNDPAGRTCARLPARRQDDEALGGIAPFDDFDGPVVVSGQGILKLVSHVAGVGEDVAQPRVGRADRINHQQRALAVPDIGGMDCDVDHMALRIDDVAFAAVDFLARVKPARAAAFRGFTDWLSMTPAVGLASRPPLSGAAMTRA